MAYIDTLIYCFIGGIITAVIPVMIVFPFYLSKKIASYAVDLRD